MRKIKQTTLSLLMFILFLVSLLGAGFILSKKQDVKAQSFQFDGTLKEKYAINETVTVPPAMFNGTEADYRIILPDGTFSDASTVTLSKAGMYEIQYSAVVKGKVYKTSKSFLVGNDMFTVNGLGSAEYRVMDGSGIGGMYVELYNGASVTFNGSIDVAELEDTLIKIIPIASVIGERDISRFQVTLTDAYDVSNTVTVRFKGNSEVTYMDATFGDRAFCGFNDAFGSGEYYVDGITGMSYTEKITKAFINSQAYGTNVLNGFSGGTVNNPKNSGKEWVGFSYDKNTQLVYARSSSGERYLMTDLDNANIYNEAFGGFKTGQVRVEIKPLVFEKGSCGLFITEIGGIKVSKTLSDAYIPENAPEIEVDYGEYANATLPKVRQGDIYKLFDAKAYDVVQGELPVRTTVYYGYNNVQRVQVNVENNEFIAKRAGIYTVVYEATNAYGMTSTELIEIYSIPDDSQLTLKIEGEIDYTKSVKAGAPVKVFDSYSFENNYGNGALHVVAKLKTDESVSFELNENNNYTFTPIVSGEYALCYEYSDYSTIGTQEKNLTVTASDIVYYETDAFPKYLIQNGKYDMSLVQAYTLDTGKPVAQKVLLFADKNGTLEEIEGLFRAKPEYVKDGKIKLVYKPQAQGIETEDCKIVEIPVVNAGLYEDRLDTTKYFVAENGELTFSKQGNKIGCTINAFNNGNASFAFANKLMVNPFRLGISPFIHGEQPFNPFERINAYIYDAQEEEQYLKLSLYEKNGAWYVSVNDGGAIEVSKQWGTLDDLWTIQYDAVSQKAVVNNVYTYTNITYFGTNTPATYGEGCNLVVEIIGQDGCDGICINNINGINRWGSSRDNSSAVVDVAHDSNAGDKPIGEIVTVGLFDIYDVFAPHVQGMLSVEYQTFTSPDLSVVKSIDGVDMKNLPSGGTYQFKLEKYGKYIVTITKYDSDNEANNGEPYSYTITVNDYSKPVVEMDTRTRVTSVGKTLKLPAYTVDKQNCKCYVTVKAPDSSFMSFVDIQKTTQDTSDDVYTFTQKGEYIITLVVYDGNYNFTETSYKVIVE